MKHYRTRFITLTFLLVTVSFLVPANAQPKAVKVPGAETWLRQIVQIKGKIDPKTQLRLSAPGVTSVYFNGQRLLRNKAVNGAVAWEVGPLIRQGSNCVSIALAATDSDRQAAAWSKLPNGEEVAWPTWKMTATAPPVGWHKTDFNDRDWKPAPAATSAPDLAAVEATVLSWTTNDSASHIANGRLEFRDGDHVVLLGGTFIERAQQFGHLEAALTASTGNHHVTFRNLGWSADTVFAESRGIFDAPAKGYERMIEHVRAEEPTLILLCYGQNEAMSFTQDESGVERFRNQLKVLHRDLTTSGTEVVFLTPHPFVTLAPPLPDATRWNDRLELFTQAVKEVAADVGSLAVDLNATFDFELLTIHSNSNVRAANADGASYAGFEDTIGKPRVGEHPELDAARNGIWTDNGMHWNEAGYRIVSQLVAKRLFGRGGNKRSQESLTIDADKNTIEATPNDVRNIRWEDSGSSLVTLQFRRSYLRPGPIRMIWKSNSAERVKIAIMSDGKQKTVIGDPTDVAGTDATPPFEQLFQAEHATDYETLRELIVRKNELYFHRWRPQNITYLFGFRKHEQGNNASDIAKFDPLIDELERQIHASKQPQWQTVTVSVAK